MKTVYSNLYYFYYLNVVGGTETFLYQLAKKYKDYDLVIVYTKADPNQLARLQKYVKCIKYEGQDFYCKKAFFNYGIDIINHVHADEYNLVIHADYQSLMKSNPNFKPAVHPKINNYIAVSKQAQKGFTAVTGKECQLCYNPFTIEKPRKTLLLISATRLTREKGKDRMIKFADILDQNNIPYIWLIFTNDTKEINNPHVVYMKPQLDITGYIEKADYLVQLSDNEGYCYSVVEALTNKTPVIVTHCPVFDEIGLKNGVNSYLLNFDMSNVPIDDIYNKIPQDFEYQPPKTEWSKLLLLNKSDYQKLKDNKFLVEALPLYREKKLKDAELGCVPAVGRQWKVSYNRLIFLLGDNKYRKPFVKLVENKE